MLSNRCIAVVVAIAFSWGIAFHQPCFAAEGRSNPSIHPGFAKATPGTQDEQGLALSQPSVIPEDDSFFLKAHSPILAACFLLLFWATAPENIQEKFLRQIQPQMLLLNFVTQYGSWLSANISHEVGHALANSMLTDRQSIIHIGGVSEEPLFTIGNVSIDGFNPLMGTTEYLSTQEDNDLLFGEYCAKNDVVIKNLKELQKERTSGAFSDFSRQYSKLPAWKDGVINAAGGISGIIGYQGVRLLAHVILAIANNDRNVWQNVFTKAMVLDQITVIQALNVIWPMNSNSDAAKIWRRCFHMPESVINTAISMAGIVHSMTFLAINYYNNKTTDAPMHSLLFLELANYNMLGFLRFEI